MAIGINSRVDLAATTNTTIATTPASGKAQILTVSLANRSASAATFNLAIVNNGTTTPSNGDYIEISTALAANTVFERTGIVLQNGQTIVAYASIAGFSAVTYGIEDNVANANTGSFKAALPTATWVQATAGPSAGRYQTVSLNICNRNSSLARIRVCISTTFNAPNAGDYIEYDSVLPGGAELERTGIVIANGQQIGVYSSVDTVDLVTMIVDDI